MGTWGAGNFENDTAAEHLIRLCTPLVEQIRNAVAQPELMEPDEYDSGVMMANVEILAVLAANIGRTEKSTIGGMIFPFPSPSVKEVKQWKREYLKVWDKYIDKLEPQGDHKSRRRRVIIETFDRLIAVLTAGPRIKDSM